MAMDYSSLRMITDLVQIRRLGEAARPGNERLRQHMKRRSFHEKRFRRIAEEIEAAIDCRVCANCCRKSTVRLSDRDIQRLFEPLRIVEQFLLKTNLREVLFRKAPEPASTAPVSPSV